MIITSEVKAIWRGEGWTDMSNDDQNYFNQPRVALGHLNQPTSELNWLSLTDL